MFFSVKSLISGLQCFNVSTYEGNGVKLSPPDPPKGGEKGQIPPSGGLGGLEPATNLTPLTYEGQQKLAGLP